MPAAHRPHLQACLAGNDPMNGWHVHHATSLNLGLEVVRALMGESLSQEELLKVERGGSSSAVGL